VTLVDTAGVYGPCLDEELVGRALTGRGDEVVLATKSGQLSHRGETDTQHIDLADLEKVRHLDSAPANIRLAVEGSLRRLGTDASTFIISTASTRPPRSRRPPEPSVSSLRGQDPALRALRSGAGDRPPGACGTSGDGSADRVLAVDQRPRERDPAPCA
jgi:hypothetical protein